MEVLDMLVNSNSIVFIYIAGHGGFSLIDSSIKINPDIIYIQVI